MATTLPWFAPPKLATREETRRARALWRVSWSFFAVIAVLLLALSVATPELTTRRLASIALVGLLVAFLHVLNRQGRTALASWIFVLGLTAIVTQRAWQAGGVQSSIALFYMMFVLMGAGLLGIRGSVITALACVASASLLVVAELAGWLVAAVPEVTTPTESFIAAVLAVAVTVLSLTLLMRQAEDVATEDLVNMFVHDMRSPLTVVMARLDMLRSDVANDSELAEHADAAMTETIHLNRMANNLLDVSRLEGTRLVLRRTPANVSELARNVARALAPLDPSRQIEVRACEPVVCECDAELVRRITENLISNALKHTETGGHVVVDVSSAVSSVRIAVEDDGPGIPEGERKQIFERYSAKSMLARNGHHSVGLGLAFCKLATAAHGGRIWVEPVTPHGSRFIVELPAM